MSEQINKAKDTLLRALEQLDKAREDLGKDPDRVDLVVVYTMGIEEEDGAWRDIGGWSSTPGPKAFHAALLRMAARANEESVYASDEEEPLPDEHLVDEYEDDSDPDDQPRL